MADKAGTAVETKLKAGQPDPDLTKVKRRLAFLEMKVSVIEREVGIEPSAEPNGDGRG